MSNRPLSHTWDRTRIARPKPTYASISAAARLSGIPEWKARELVEQGRARTATSAGEQLICIEDLDQVAALEGWA